MRTSAPVSRRPRNPVARARARYLVAPALAGLAAAWATAHCAAHPVDAVIWEGAGDAGSSRVTTMVWPNPASTANSDPWIAQHHDQIAVLQPQVLFLDFANRFATESGGLVAAGYDLSVVQQLIDHHVNAFHVASQYHGYNNPNASTPAFLQYQIKKIVDLRDASGNVNSRLLPVTSANPPGVDYAQLNSTSFATLMGIKDPDNPAAYLNLCGLFEKGIINEVWAMTADPVTPSDPASVKFDEVTETKQAYDANNNPIPGQLTCTTTPCINQALPCKVTTRLYDFNPGRGAGCHLFDNGLLWQTYLTAPVLPAFARVARTFFNFDFEQRFGASFPSFYSVCPPVGPDAGACITWPSQIQALGGPASTMAFNFLPMSAGCGNVIFPPNATGYSVQAGDPTVVTSCENYGLHNGPNGADQTTPYTNAIATGYYGTNPDVASDCGGSQPTYILASMPGLGTTATAPDGTAMKNWWVYLFY